MSKDYKSVAKLLGVRHIFGKWGIQLHPKAPSGQRHKLFTIIPLDGWVTDPQEVVKIMRKRKFQL